MRLLQGTISYITTPDNLLQRVRKNLGFTMYFGKYNEKTKFLRKKILKIL